MKYLALLTVPLFLAIGAGARQAPETRRSFRQPAPSGQAAQTQQMSPRQVAEMRADILVARKEYAMAAQAYERILATDRKNPALLNKIGMAYQQIGDYGKAEHYYKRAWKFDKHFTSAMNNLGTVEYAKRRYRSAVKDYRKALKVGTERATIYSNLGYAYCGRKDYPRATIAFSMALRLDPNIFARHGEGGSIFLQRSAPDPGTVYFLVAKSYAKLGDAPKTAHYLKLARDSGYKRLREAQTDPAFKRVIHSALVQEVLRAPTPFAPGNQAAQN